VGADNETLPTFNPNDHSINYVQKIGLQESKSYDLSFMVYTDGDVQDLQVRLLGVEVKKNSTERKNIDLLKPFSASSSWSQVTEDFSWRSQYDNRGVFAPFNFSFHWRGKGAVYLDDILLKAR
jgi:hypothetical protein